MRGVSALDHNHTHFLLVDNGTEKKFGEEIAFRTELEQYISQVMETGVAKDASTSKVCQFYMAWFELNNICDGGYK